MSLVGMSALALVFGIMFERAGSDADRQRRRELSKSERKRSDRKKKGSKRSVSKKRTKNADNTLNDSFRKNEHYVGGRDEYEDERENKNYDQGEYYGDARQVYYAGADREGYDYEEMRDYPMDSTDDYHNYRRDVY